MVQSSVFKTQVVLSDYPYRKDIEHRVLISNLSVFEVEVLQEILHNTLIIPIEKLAENLDVKAEGLIPVLDGLSKTKLFKREERKIVVDKELRKYYESQMEKFDEDFEPNFEFLQSLLSKVPLPVLLGWYTLPRTSTNIFSSIIEQVFQTPAVYRQYLSELKFSNPVLKEIIKDLNKSPDHEICAKEIIKKYELTREAFEEYLLLLEFHFVCCLRYIKKGDKWEEVVTFFSEWREFLEFEKRASPPVIKNQKEVQPNSPTDFCFVKDLAISLRAIQEKKGGSQIQEMLNFKSKEWYEILLDKLLQIEMIAEGEKRAYEVTEKGLLWLKKSMEDQILALSLDPLNTLISFDPKELWNTRNLRLIGNSLKPLIHHKWVYLDDYVEGFSGSIGTKDPVKLVKKGTKWKYILPRYDAHEIQFIRSVIMERFFELGIVMTGKHDDRPCFYLTKFGHQFVN